MLGMTFFEHRSEKVISPARFASRMIYAAGLWLAVTLAGLLIGMAGYAAFENMSGVDAFLNAAMILSGMGPAQPLSTVAGKIFAGCYAILSGLIIVIASSFILAPIVHRILHRFHIERGRSE